MWLDDHESDSADEELGNVYDRPDRKKSSNISLSSISSRQNLAYYALPHSSPSFYQTESNRSKHCYSSSLPTFPDLTSTIDLHFSTRRPSNFEGDPSDRFRHVEQIYREHKKQEDYERIYRERWKRKKSSSETSADCPLSHSPSSVGSKNILLRSPSCTEAGCIPHHHGHARNLSTGSIPIGNARPGRLAIGHFDIDKNIECSPVWCLECQDNLVFVGCGNGDIEIWDICSNSIKVCIKKTLFINFIKIWYFICIAFDLLILCCISLFFDKIYETI